MESEKQLKILDLEYEVSKNIRKLDSYYGSIYIKNWDLKQIEDIENRLADITHQVSLLKKELKEKNETRTI